MGIHSKNKGKAGEREVRDLFRAAFTGVVDDVEVIRRNHQQAEVSGVGVSSSDLTGVPHFSVEVKRVKQISWGKQLDVWWDQCCQSAKEDKKWPCLVFRQDRGNWFVMVWSYSPQVHTLVRTLMLWDDFEDFVKNNLK